MRHLVSIIFFVSCLFFTTQAQVDSVYMGNPEGKPKSPSRPPKSDAWKNTIIWGGNFQLWLGNPTFILLSPTIGFAPYEKVNVGIGFIYNYTSYQSRYGTYSQSIYGGHTFARYLVTDNYFLQAQFDKLYQPNLLSYDPNDNIWVDYFLVGGGFRQKLGAKTMFNTSIMYNLTPSPLSIYPSRVLLQFGIVSGF